MISVSIRQKAVALILAAFVLAGALGAGHFGMSMMGEGEMGGCPFMNTALCTMDATEHLGEWQTMFASPLKDLYAAAALICLLAITVSLRHAARLRAALTLLRTRYRVARSAYTKVFLETPRVLQESFSQGILNTRAF